MAMYSEFSHLKKWFSIVFVCLPKGKPTYPSPRCWKKADTKTATSPASASAECQSREARLAAIPETGHTFSTGLITMAFKHHSPWGFLRIIKINVSNISWQTIATSSKGSTIYTTNSSKKKHVQSNPTIGSNSFQSTKVDELLCPNSYYNDFTHVDAHKADIFAFIFIDAAIFTSLGDHVQQPSIIYLI